MALSVLPAFSINVSSRFRFVGISGSEASYISGVDADVDAVAGGGGDDVEAEADGDVDGDVDSTSVTGSFTRVS